MLAIIDAGVESKGVLVAVAVAFLQIGEGEGGRTEMILDPTPAEEEKAKSNHLVCVSFGVEVGGEEGTCVGVDSVGRFDEEEVRFAFCFLFCGETRWKKDERVN